MSDCSVLQRVLTELATKVSNDWVYAAYPRRRIAAVYNSLLLHGWCQVKLLPASVRPACTVHHYHTTMHPHSEHRFPAPSSSRPNCLPCYLFRWKSALLTFEPVTWWICLKNNQQSCELDPIPTRFFMKTFTSSCRPSQGQTINQQVYNGSCGVCFAQCARRDESCDRTNRGCFTTTMHLLTTPWASGSSWPRRTSPYWNNLPIHPILLRVAF